MHDFDVSAVCIIF